MFPSSSCADLISIVGQYAIARSARTGFSQRGGVSNCSNLFPCEPRLAIALPRVASYQAHARGVLAVFKRRTIFQISVAVIALDAINVVDGITVWAWPNKRLCDKMVDLHRFVGAALTKACAGITVLISGRLQDAARAASSQLQVAAHAPEVRDAVHAFVPQHWTPFFRRKFFSGKFLNSHDLNLRRRSGLWLGSFGAQTPFGPFVF